MEKEVSLILYLVEVAYSYSKVNINNYLLSNWRKKEVLIFLFGLFSKNFHVISIKSSYSMLDEWLTRIVFCLTFKRRS